MEILVIVIHNICVYPCLDSLYLQVVVIHTNIFASISWIKRNYNLAYVLVVLKSKKIICVCLHLGHSVH